MTLQWITKDEAIEAGAQEERLFTEQSPAHYAEFAAFLGAELANAGGNLYYRGPGGTVFRIGKIAPDDPEGLKGYEVCVRVAAHGQTTIADIVDADVWPLLEWIIEGVGAGWSVEALATTGAIYKAPGAPERP